MKNFLKKIILFTLSLGIIFIFPISIFILGREYTLVKDIVTSQKTDPNTLYSFAYNDVSFIPYKQALVKENNPEVVALGTSRVMQIRKELFNNRTNFINAGGAGKSLEDDLLLIQNLSTTTKVILLGIEQDTFYKNSVTEKIKENSYFDELKLIVLNTRRIYLDYFNGKYTFTDLYKKRNDTTIGLSAKIYGDGFRSDGSYKYNQAFKNTNRLEYVSLHVASDVNNLKLKELNTKELNAVNDNLKLLEKILLLAKKKNIIVVGFMPPYPTPLYEAMLKEGGVNTHKLSVLPDTIETLFNTYKMDFFNFSSISSFGGKETEFVDGIHGTDLMYARMMLYIASKEPFFNTFIDINSIKRKIETSQNDFLSF